MSDGLNYISKISVSTLTNKEVSTDKRKMAMKYQEAKLLIEMLFNWLFRVFINEYSVTLII